LSLGNTVDPGAGSLRVTGNSTVLGNDAVTGNISSGGTVTVGSTLAVTSTSQMGGRVQIGSTAGLSPSFPAWRNSGAQMEAVLGDNSAFADIRGSRIFAQSAGSSFIDISVNGAAVVPNRFAMVSTAVGVTAVAGQLVLGNGTFNVTLPAATAGMVVDVKNVGTGVVTVLPAAGTIDGAANYPLSVQYQSVTVVADGTNWWIR
jgi:hypothetical protein